MLYALLKVYARLAIKVYCPYIYINKPFILKSKGPLLLACNHPNSFLDGILLTTLFNQPVYSLARGDAFKNPFVHKLLLLLKLLPVYRTSEGVDNLEHNYTTFSACRQLFHKKGIVVIFSEAGCTNEWHLRPLRKGTARLAISSWQHDIPLTVLPVALNYNSFKSFGKVVHLFFGEPIPTQQVMQEENSGKRLLQFNRLLKQELQQYVYEIKQHDQQTVLKKFKVLLPISKKVGLLLPGFIGWLLHLPLYALLKSFTNTLFSKSDHYDSVLTALLVLLYPVYLLAIIIIVGAYINWRLAFFFFWLLPFCAWAFMQVRVAKNVAATI